MHRDTHSELGGLGISMIQQIKGNTDVFTPSPAYGFAGVFDACAALKWENGETALSCPV
jgi:hypothetical protein